jgi:hypothetical protein
MIPSGLSTNSCLRVCSLAELANRLTDMTSRLALLLLLHRCDALRRRQRVSHYHWPPTQAQSCLCDTTCRQMDIAERQRVLVNQEQTSLLTHRFTLLPSSRHLLVLVLLAHPGQTGLGSLLLRGRCRPRCRGRFVVPCPLVEGSCLRRSRKLNRGRRSSWSGSRGGGWGFGWRGGRLSRWF